MSAPFVKVCGVREGEVLSAAIAAGASAIGLNFVASSRRAVTVEAARELAGAARDLGGERAPRLVGIFADAEAETIEATRRAVGLDLVQLHGHESAALVARCQPGYKALRLGAAEDLEDLADYAGPFVLIDARVPGKLGGTGQRIPLELVARAARLRPVVVAGGLTHGNVAEVIRQTRPAGVDTASGAEDASGAPSPAAAARFVSAALAAFEE